MPPSRLQAIQPRNDSDDDEDLGDVVADNDSVSESDEEEGDADDDDVSQTSADSAEVVGGQEQEPEPEADLKDISFGVLAEAQARFNPIARKRKLADREDSAQLQNDEHSGYRGHDEDSWREKAQRISRSSKHAPTIMTTRKPVSRKRAIFSPPPAEKYRDPRFDAPIVADARRGNTSSTQRATKNYAFLSDYQAAEVLGLKAQLKKTRDPDQQAQLKREIMSIDSKLRNAQVQRREAEILQEHKKKEREAIKAGQKARPYYLKQSDLKKQIEQERQDAMGKRAKDKSEKRKKKREKTKDARDMPRFRRAVNQDS